MLATKSKYLVVCLFVAACGSRGAGRDLKLPITAENTSETCSDTLDNDIDTLIDQADPDCLPFYLAAETNCSDTLDNDGDQATDCDDSDCASSADCSLAEDNATECTDGDDNDDDGDADCADAGCKDQPVCGPEASARRCGDNFDNDGDGLVDCFDDECAQNPDVDYCGAENDNDLCRDGIDNDADELIDCADDDCAATRPCAGTGNPENTDPLCADQLDNDDDGGIDCQDDDCRDAELGGCAGAETGDLCDDDRDNDGDSSIDCADSDCAAEPVCQNLTPETSLTACKDGDDNDGDGLTDCADSDCKTSPDVTYCGPEEGALCGDQIDNDVDGAIDCLDTACVATPGCATGNLEDSATECSDGQDNDSDNTRDCADEGCKSQPFCGPENTNERCADSIDNDFDNTLDCLDTDCAAALPCTAAPENTDALCKNGTDDDGDDKVDCADDSCAAVATACGPETGETFCADGRDNDNDGVVDCNDSGCAAAAACTGTAENCTNGSDDDGDTFVDCADFDCLLDFGVAACDAALAVVDLQDSRTTDFPANRRGDTVNDPVRLRDVVVNFVDPDDDRLFYVTDAGATPAIYTGMRVFLPESVPYPTAVVEGDIVDLAGLLTEFIGETEVIAYALDITGSDLGLLPDIMDATLADLTGELAANEALNDRFVQNPTTGTVTDPTDDFLTAERYEGMLIALENLVVVGVNLNSEGDAVDSLEVAESFAATTSTFLGLRYLQGTGLELPDETLPVGTTIDLLIGIQSYHRRKVGSAFVREYRIEPLALDGLDLPVDTDGDGLSDEQEDLLGTDPTDTDTDRDEFTDGYEVGDPSNPSDIDDDGIIDALESFFLDHDGDGWPNEFDAADYGAPTADRDLDGTPNSSDLDDDDDGVADVDDNCPLAPESLSGTLTNQLNADSASDPGDAYDLSDSGNACDFDLDGDLVANAWDNCPYDFNPGADLFSAGLDSDGDGWGDECDIDPNTPVGEDDHIFHPYPVPCTDLQNGGFVGCDLIIEEVLYKLPAQGTLTAIDANGDGVGDFEEDEFIELRNVSDHDLDLSGLEIHDATTLLGGGAARHTVPTGTVLRRGARLVVFGGGLPFGFGGDTVVQTASSGVLGLNNTGAETISLILLGDELAYLDFGLEGEPSSDSNRSITRYPEGTDYWISHPLRDQSAGLRHMSVGASPDNELP